MTIESGMGSSSATLREEASILPRKYRYLKYVMIFVIIVVLAFGVALGVFLTRPRSRTSLNPSPTAISSPVPTQTVNQNVSYVITTLAGTGAGEYRDGPALEAAFNEPKNVAVDSSGIVYVADAMNNRIRSVANGLVSTLAGGGTQEIDGPALRTNIAIASGVAVGSEGTIFVVDLIRHKIKKIDNGLISSLAGSGTFGSQDGIGPQATFFNPDAIAVDQEGSVYVADAPTNRIRKITPTGNVTTLAGGDAKAFVDGPGRIARFNYPINVCLGEDQSIYVTDTLNHRIRRISRNGEVSTIAGSGQQGLSDGPALSASFNEPMGIVFYDGAIYVSDSKNHKIRKIVDGRVITIAGTGGPGDRDGEGITASFNVPRGIAAHNGTLYIADQNNHKIRMIKIN
jgi:sugar lactone lactonase YvrE